MDMNLNIQITSVAYDDLIDGTEKYTRGDQLICTGLRVHENGIAFLNGSVVVGEMVRAVPINGTLEINLSWEARISIETLPPDIKARIQNRVAQLMKGDLD